MIIMTIRFGHFSQFTGRFTCTDFCNSRWLLPVDGGGLMAEAETERLTTRLLYLHHEFMISARQALSVDRRRHQRPRGHAWYVWTPT